MPCLSGASSKHIDYEGASRCAGVGELQPWTVTNFAFGKAFSNTCQSVQITRRIAERSLFSVTACSKSSFTINRSNDINGSQDFYYMAMGF